jgi:uncharacterized Zn finger protein
MRKNIRCPACGRQQKKSHDRLIKLGKPYHPKCQAKRKGKVKTVKYNLSDESLKINRDPRPKRRDITRYLKI